MARKIRISIARLMAVVLIAAIGFAALRNSSDAWAGLMLMLTCGVLLLGLVGAVCRGPHVRAWWLGFTLFGSSYLALAHATAFSATLLPTISLAEFVGSGLGAKLNFSPRNAGNGWDSLEPLHRILHCLWALTLAVLGCVLGGLLVASPADAPAQPIDETCADQRLSSLPWKRPALIGLAGFWILALAATVGRWPAPGIWAGASFLLTMGLLGLAGLGAAFSRGRAREKWLGAALFGFGYLALTFGKSQLFVVAAHLPTEGMLNGLLRPGGPPIHSHFPDFTSPAAIRVRNQLIMRKLDQPIPMHFPKDTPLEEVLKHIRQATADVNFPGIPIYVDPVGLKIAERSMTSTVRNIDWDAIPVRDGLRLCLRQLDLGFSVRQGYVMISDGDSATIPVYEDPVQVVGHSLLALIAAGVGASAAGLVSDRTGRLERAGVATATVRTSS
jgi:type IV secretory pathway VirB2 component (pilin)